MDLRVLKRFEKSTLPHLAPLRRCRGGSTQSLHFPYCSLGLMLYHCGQMMAIETPRAFPRCSAAKC